MKINHQLPDSVRWWLVEYFSSRKKKYFLVLCFADFLNKHRICERSRAIFSGFLLRVIALEVELPDESRIVIISRLLWQISFPTNISNYMLIYRRLNSIPWSPSWSSFCCHFHRLEYGAYDFWVSFLTVMTKTCTCDLIKFFIIK